MSVVVEKNIKLLFWGKLVSILGSNIYSFAISLYILEITGSPLLFSLNMVLTVGVRVLLSPFAGLIVDRFDRKSLVLISDFLSGFTMLFVYVITLFMKFGVVQVYASTFLLTLFNTLFSVAISSSIPNFTDKQHLNKANSYSQLAASIAQIAGPIIGGFFFALVDIRFFILANGISFILSSISEYFIDFSVSAKEETLKRETSFFVDLKESITYLNARKYLYKLTFYSLIGNFFAAIFFVALPIISLYILKMDAELYGFIPPSFAIGMILISTWISKRKKALDAFKGFSNGIILFGSMYFVLLIPVVISGLSLMFSFFIVLVTGILMGGIMVSINIPMATAMQILIDDEYRGRVNGLISSVEMSLSPISILLAGTLFTYVSPSVPLAISGGILVVSGVFFRREKGIETKIAQVTDVI